MAPLVRDEIYWIAYEAMRNARTRSGARHVRVELMYVQDFELRVCDDGKGIEGDILQKGWFATSTMLQSLRSASPGSWLLRNGAQSPQVDQWF